MEEVTIQEWLKKPGEPVREGEPFLVVETDKAALYIEAPVDGYLRKTMAEPGERVTLNGVLAIFSTAPDEPVAEEAAPARASLSAASATAEPRPGEVADRPRHRASPAVRRRARELGFDLAGIVGTGPHGRIRMEDVEARASAPKTIGADAAGASLQLGRIRLVTARRMMQSAAEIPQFTLRHRVDMRAVLELRTVLRASFARSGARLSLMDFLLQASSEALMAHPNLRAVLDGPLSRGTVQIRPHASIGIAVDTPAGLLVPVLPGVEKLSLVEIARMRNEAVQAAVSGALPARFLAPGTFTVSNLGPFDVDEFHALVNPGEAAILAVGSIRKVVGVEGERPVPKDELVLTFTFDHRLVDGAEGARFAKTLVDRLEGRDWRII